MTKGVCKLSKCNYSVRMPVHTKEPALKVHMQALGLRCGLYANPVIPEPCFTPIAQYRQHQCIRHHADAVRICQVDLAQRLSMLLFMALQACSWGSPDAACI